jgi:hypothetical protein
VPDVASEARQVFGSSVAQLRPISPRMDVDRIQAKMVHWALNDWRADNPHFGIGRLWYDGVAFVSSKTKEGGIDRAHKDNSSQTAEQEAKVAILLIHDGEQ